MSHNGRIISVFYLHTLLLKFVKKFATKIASLRTQNFAKFCKTTQFLEFTHVDVNTDEPKVKTVPKRKGKVNPYLFNPERETKRDN